MKSTFSYASFAIGVLAIAACARSTSMNGVALSGAPDMSTSPPSPDPRVGLTCRGSHTHTVVTDPNDANNVYIYVSGSAPVRSPSELPGCSDALPEEDPNSALFRIEVIQVPLAHPEQSHIVSSPRIFDNLAAVTRHAETPADIAARDSARAAAARTGVAGAAAGRGGR